MFASRSGHLSFPGSPSKPHNSSTLPRNPSPRDRVKSHCLRPLPPPDPAPARPLRGIWLGGRGRGWFAAWEQSRSPPFHFHPGRGSRTCCGPLCCPPRPPGRTAASPSTLEAPRRRGGRSSRLFNADPHRQDGPHYRRSHLLGRLPSPGSRWEGGRKEGTRDCVHERHGPLAPLAPAPGSWPQAVGRTASGCPKPCQPPAGSDGRPLVPNGRQ